jgi:hypothetical protein
VANASENRSTSDVIEDHLERRCDGDREEDLRRNADRDVVIPTSTSVNRAVVVCGEVGYLEWTAQTRQAQIQDGADGFAMRERPIVAQTIHYIARSADGDRLSSG